MGHVISLGPNLLSTHRLLSQPHSSELCGSFTLGCCKYLARYPTDLTLPKSMGTKSFGILRSLRYIRWRSTLRPAGCSNLLILAQVTLVVTKVKFVLAVCYRLLQIHDTLPSEYHAALPGDHQMLADNASQLLSRIQSPIPETSQLTDVQEAVVSACGGTSSISKKLHCPMEGCDVTFGRLQERKRHLIDVHTPRRQCPFCSYKWSPGRPNKIKTHLTENHQDKPHVLIEIGGQRGQRVVAFLNTLCDAMK